MFAKQLKKLYTTWKQILYYQWDRLLKAQLCQDLPLLFLLQTLGRMKMQPGCLPEKVFALHTSCFWWAWPTAETHQVCLSDHAPPVSLPPMYGIAVWAVAVFIAFVVLSDSIAACSSPIWALMTAGCMSEMSIRQPVIIIIIINALINVKLEKSQLHSNCIS